MAQPEHQDIARVLGKVLTDQRQGPGSFSIHEQPDGLHLLSFTVRCTCRQRASALHTFLCLDRPNAKHQDRSHSAVSKSKPVVGLDGLLEPLLRPVTLGQQEVYPLHIVIGRRGGASADGKPIPVLDLDSLSHLRHPLHLTAGGSPTYDPNPWFAGQI